MGCPDITATQLASCANFLVTGYHPEVGVREYMATTTARKQAEKALFGVDRATVYRLRAEASPD
jgi:hypothetical protein